MTFVKKLSMALVAILTVGVLAAGSASAAPGDGSASVQAGPGTPCDITFTLNGTAVEDIVQVSPCEYADLIPIDITGSELDATFSGGVATLSGTVEADLGFFGTCEYDTATLGDIVGTYSDSGSVRSFDGGPQDIDRVSGGFPCPDPMEDVTLTNGLLEL